MRVIYAERVGDAIETNATYQDKELMRAIPGSRFHTPPPIWTVNLSWATCKQLRGTFGERLTIGPELKRWAEAQLETRVNPSMALRGEYEPGNLTLPLPLPPDCELRPFQTVDVVWANTAGSGVLMTPTGGGKTVVMLTWMRNHAFDRVLWICKKGSKIDIAEECEKWYPELEPIVVKGSAKERRELIQEAGQYGGLCIINYDIARTHSRLAPYGQVALTQAEKTPKDLNFEPWEVVIADEAHRLADPKSKQTRVTWALGQMDTVKYRWALTATPTTKGIDTLWPALHFADPNEWPSKSKFVERYAETTTNFWGGQVVGAVRPEMEAEFYAIFDPMSRRLPKEVVLPQLPPIVRSGSKKAEDGTEYPFKVREVEMGKEQATAYRQMADLSLAEVLGGDVVTATSTAAQYTRLGQFASSYAYLGEPQRRKKRHPQPGEDEYEMFRPVELAMPSNKIDALFDDLHDWLAQDEAVIVFATSRRLINLTSERLRTKKIRGRLVPHSVIVGGQTEMERHEQKAAFQRGEVPIILVVTSAGGESITLTTGRIMAVMQRPWAKWQDEQAEGRYQRIGSEIHESLLRVDYVTPGTTDVGQLDVLENKNEIMQQVLRDKATIRQMVFGGHIKAKETA